MSKINKIMPNRYVKEEEEYNKDLLLFIQKCQIDNTPFVINYVKKDGRRRNIYCDHMNWLKHTNYIYNYDIQNEIHSMNIFHSIVKWIEEEFNEPIN